MRSFLHRLLVLLAVVLAAPGRVSAQILDPGFHIPELYQEAFLADAAQQPNGQYVVAGNFTRANGQAANTLARFDAAGTADQTFRQNLSGATVQARKVYPMANGQLLVIGSYQAGAVQRSYLFRLNADGTLDPTLTLTFSGPYPYPSITQVLVQPDGRILILGYFTGGNAEIYRLLPNGTRDPSFSVTLQTGSQDAQMLLQPDGKLLIGGDIIWVNGVQKFFIARLNPDGSTDTSYQPAAYTNARLYINTLALDASGALLVGGFSGNVVGGQPRSVFRLLPSGALDTSFGLDASLVARDCQRLTVQPSGQVVAFFDAYAHTSSSTVGLPFSAQLVRLLPSGSLDASFQPGSGPDGVLTNVQSLASGSLLVWGGIHNFAGQRRTLALLQPSGALDASFAPLLQVPGEVQKIVRQADGKLVLLGKFNTVDAHLTDCVARLLPTGQPDLTFSARQAASAVSNLTTLAVQSTGQVLLAGSVLKTGTGDGLRPFFSRLTATGAPDASFTPAITLAPTGTAGVRLLGEQPGGQLVVGGSFVDAAGKANLTRLTANGSVDPTFTPPSAQPVVYNGRVLPDGSIVSVVPAPGSTNYPFSQGIQRLLPSGQPDPSFSYVPLAPGPDIGLGAVFPLSAGGYVTSGVYSTGQVMARLTATGATVPGFAAPFYPRQGPADSYSGVRIVAAQSDGRLLVGGTLFSNPTTALPFVPLARLEANGQLDASFSTSFISITTNLANGYTSAVNDLLIQPDGTTLVGGYFLQAGGQPATGLVRLQAPTLLAAGAAQRSSAAVQAWPVPAHEVLHLSLAAAARPQRVTLLNALGQPVLTQAVTQPELTLSTAALAPGLYLLRVEYTDGLATRSVVLE
jgi:uncharacterized delta-60 repeat protein